jgi:hypothetical protein
MNAFTNYLEKMGSNFLVAALVPSLAFVVAVFFLFDPIANIAQAFDSKGGIYQLVGFSLVIFILTVIIGFTLTALNTYILKIFEGYEILFPLHIMYMDSWRKHKLNAHRLRLHRDRLKTVIRKREEEENGSYLRREQDPELNNLIEKYYQTVSEYQSSYPENPADILPTAFGNSLKAAENYPGERYGLDGIHFWPRLVDVIPTDYKLSIDNVRNELSFLVNMSILSFIFSIVCIPGMGFSLYKLSAESGSVITFLTVILELGKYFIAAALGIASCTLFYKASIYSVSSFGLMIRSSFDLFRMDLLKKLGVERPRDSIEEFERWQELNELVVLGSHSLTFTKIDYSKEEKKQ